MSIRSLIGSVTSYTFNRIVTYIPSRTIRRLYLRFALAKLGRGCGVQIGCRFLNSRRVAIGNGSVLNFDCLIDGRKHDVLIGDNVSIGPEATLLTLGHDPQDKDFIDKGGPIQIGNRVWIGYRAIILPNVRIGEGAVVAAGSVVTKDVEPFTIVAGSPARKISDRNQHLQYQLDYRPWLT